jgi:membrane protease YdiL (CAAX protease family)
MRTEIGRGLRGRRIGVAAGVGLLTLAADFWIVLAVWQAHYTEGVNGRWALALVALTIYLWLADGDLPTAGLTGPAGGWRRWAKLALALGLVAGVVMAAALQLWVAAGWRLPVQSVRPANVVPAFFHICVFAPLLEETLYRVILCVPLAAVVGPWRAVAVSGVVFGLLHVAYGNPSPENALGGFFLAWAYLRSGSVLVPVLFHSAGNLLVLVGQVVAWHLIGDL